MSQESNRRGFAVVVAIIVVVVAIVLVVIIVNRGEDTAENQSGQQAESSENTLPSNWHELSVAEQWDLDPFGCVLAEEPVGHDGRCVATQMLELPDGQTLQSCTDREAIEAEECGDVIFAVYQNSHGSDPSNVYIGPPYDESGNSLSLLTLSNPTPDSSFIDGIQAVRDDDWQGDNCDADAFAGENTNWKHYSVDDIDDSPYHFTFDISDEDQGRRYCFRLQVDEQGGLTIPTTPVYITSDPIDLVGN